MPKTLITEHLARVIWEAKYTKKMTWDEIVEKSGGIPGINRHNLFNVWKRYGIKIPRKYRREESRYEGLEDKLGVDTTTLKG